MKKNTPKKPQGNRAGLRPRVQPGKAKTTFARARAPVQVQKSKPAQNQRKAVNQKLAIQRLNKARATLQKAVKAVSVANKNLAKTMPEKKTPQKRSNSLARGNNARLTKSPQKKNQQLNRSGQFGRVGNKGRIQKRQIKRGDVAIKFNNRGPSGRGRGRVNVVRDTLKKEKPATSLDDRFSQLLKSAGRTASRANRGGAKRGGSSGRGNPGRGGNRGGNRGQSRGGQSRRGNNRGNRRY